ncbi:hypothetical protein A5647_13210 [Mycobacterium sp. 1100029.7]|nr:hypothetical protein A5647_13210 [Mycobacterium sp. 1100029.7]
MQMRLIAGAVGRDISVFAVALVIPAFQPRRETVNPDADHDQEGALCGQEKFVHSRSISRAIAACSK